MMNEPVSTIMTKEVIAVHPDDTLDKVKKLFFKNRIHHVAVLDGDEIKGILTTWDLWKIDQPFTKYSELSVKEIMTTRLAKVEPSDKIGTAAELFLFNRFHALPVVENEKLVGLITTFDVLAYEFKKEYPKPILHSELYAQKDSGALPGHSNQ